MLDTARMSEVTPRSRWILLILGAVVVAGIVFSALPSRPLTEMPLGRDTTVTCPQSGGRKPLDCSGAAKTGVASFYAARFGGRKMADGTPMKLNGDNAASLTVPLGTTARVTNLDTGQSAIVTVRDRGPYVADRIVDLSPGTARKLGISRRQGLAKVEVAPIAVPMPDGSIHLGEGAFAKGNVLAP